MAYITAFCLFQVQFKLVVHSW